MKATDDLIALLIFLSFAGSAHGAVTAIETLHNSGPYDEGLWGSDLSAPSRNGPLGQFADTFFLSEIGQVTQVNFWGAYFEPTHGVLPEDHFSLRFYSVSDGVPGSLPGHNTDLIGVSREVFVPGTGLTIPIYGYTATLSEAVTLSAGIHGVSIVNDLGSDPLYWRVGLSQDLSGDAFARSIDGESWTPVAGEIAIELQGVAIPEPAANLFLTMAAACMLRRRRKLGDSPGSQ